MFNWLFTEEHKAKVKAAKEQRTKERKERQTGTWERETSKPPKGSRPKPAPSWSRSHTVTINNDTIIVNGKKLTPGTPEYIRAKRAANIGLKAGMKGLDAGMKALDASMEAMDDMFEDIF